MKRLVSVFVLLVVTFSLFAETNMGWWSPRDEFGDVKKGVYFFVVSDTGVVTTETNETYDAVFYIELWNDEICYAVIKGSDTTDYLSFIRATLSIKEEDGTVWKYSSDRNKYMTLKYIDLGGLNDKVFTNDNGDSASIKELMDRNIILKMAFKSGSGTSGHVTYDLTKFKSTYDFLKFL